MRDIRVLLANFNGRPGASDTEIAEAESQLNLKLPEHYVDFLKMANGGEGFIGTHAYLILWEIDELATLNESYQVREYVPGFLIFGSDGGGEAFGFDTRTTTWPILQIPFIEMEWSVARAQGDSFNDFLESLYETE